MTDPRDSFDHRALASRELQPGERLVWSGRSDPAVLFGPRDAFLIPFSILWCGFVAFWIGTAVASGAPPFFVAFGGVFAVIGLHMLIGRFVVKRYRKRTTAYAVTDRRAFVTNGRTTRETPADRRDRTVRWSGDRSHCSVQWSDPGRNTSLFGNRSNTMIYANTGLDGLFGPQEMAFWDVADGEALIRALG